MTLNALTGHREAVPDRLFGPYGIWDLILRFPNAERLDRFGRVTRDSENASCRTAPRDLCTDGRLHARSRRQDRATIGQNKPQFDSASTRFATVPSSA